MMSGPSGRTDLRRVREAELLGNVTWPCREEEAMGGWLLREGRGHTRRANSVLPDGDGPGELDSVVDRIRDWYESRGVEPCVKITPLAPDGLDDFLMDRGWAKFTPCHVMSRDLQRFTATVPGEMVERPALDPDAVGCHATWEGQSPRARSLEEEILGRMPHARWMGLEQEGSLRGVVLVSTTGRLAHLYSLVIDPSHRAMGLGRRLVAGCLQRLASEGFERAYLQVMEDNDVALALYTSMGFTRVHDYHYRVVARSASWSPAR